MIDIEDLIKKIDSMNARMDSFVDQITTTKNILYDKAQKDSNAIERHISKSQDIVEKLKEIINIDQVNDLISKLITEKNDKFIKDQDKKIKQFTKLIEDKVNYLENYLKDEKFHSLLNELKELENEFQQKAIDLVKKVSLKKGK